jgi:hypothetical protein
MIIEAIALIKILSKFLVGGELFDIMGKLNQNFI